jgi:hypothetical protein
VERPTKIFLIICLVAFVVAFLVQTVFQFLGAEKSVWGGNPGWQREIAFWNVGLAIVVFLTLRLNEQRPAMAVAAGCTVLFLLLGTNHLFAFIADPKAEFHWPPLVFNYVGLVAGIRLFATLRSQRRSMET